MNIAVPTYGEELPVQGNWGLAFGSPSEIENQSQSNSQLRGRNTLRHARRLGSAARIRFLAPLECAAYSALSMSWWDSCPVAQGCSDRRQTRATRVVDQSRSQVVCRSLLFQNRALEHPLDVILDKVARLFHEEIRSNIQLDFTRSINFPLTGSIFS